MRYAIPDQLNTLRVEGRRTEYFLNPQAGTSIEDVMHPDSFVHCRKRVKLYDIFEVVAQDGTFEAKFRVTFVNAISGVMKFRLLSYWTPSANERAEPIVQPRAETRFTARWNVGANKHQVVEKATGQVVAEGFGSKAEAQAAATEMENERDRKAA